MTEQPTDFGREIDQLAERLPKDAALSEKIKIVGHILADYDFLDNECNSTSFRQPAPHQVLLAYLETSYLEDEYQKHRAVWLIALAKYWLIQAKNVDPADKNVRIHRFCRTALELGRANLEKAIRLDGKKKSINREKMKKRGDKKYQPNRALKRYVYELYEIELDKQKAAGMRVTRESIVTAILPLIEERNIHPETEQKIIGKEKADGTPGDTFRAVLRWIDKGISTGNLRSTRTKL